MKKNLITLVIIISLTALFSGDIIAQVKNYPNDPAGDKAAERTGLMTGNRVLLFFRNTTELSDCCQLGYDVSKWPNNFDGTTLIDDRVNNHFPMPLESSNKYDVTVGRIRKGMTHDNEIMLFACGDQLLKGAALNAVQIVEALVE